ncbi:MAG: hypothetical protein J6A87_05690 [Clostridia bacterium]|nr:hypothetical protein [Clostridia bacterium]
MFWWRVGEFFKTVFTAIGKALAFPFVMLWRFLVWFFTEGHFVPLIPVAVMGLYALGWLTGFLQSWKWGADPLWEYFPYKYNVTVWGVNWLTNFEHGFLSAITLGIIQIAFIVVAAIFETLLVYVLFFGIGSILWFIIAFVFYIIVLFVVPLAAIAYSVGLVAKYDTSARWWRILCLLLTVGGVVFHCCIIFPAFGKGF